MKINPFDHLTPAQTKAPGARPAEDGPDFARFLAEQEAAQAAKGPAGAHTAGSAPAALLENQAVSGLMLQGLESVNQQTRRQLAKTLDQMDSYAQALGDEARTLKEIAPLAENLGQAADRLSRLSVKLNEGDPLKGLTTEAAVLATVEAMKFKRGDYV
jgi:hypothetical protein